MLKIASLPFAPSGHVDTFSPMPFPMPGRQIRTTRKDARYKYGKFARPPAQILDQALSFYTVFLIWTLSNICSRIVLFTEPRDYDYDDYYQSRRNYNYNCKSNYKL